MNTKATRSILAIMTASLAIIGLVGCGSDSGGPDAKAQAKNVENAKSMRSYFDKVHGDYSQLTGVDRDEYVKLAGGEEKAQQDWNLMKNGPGAGRPGAPTPPGAPTGQ